MPFINLPTTFVVSGGTIDTVVNPVIASQVLGDVLGDLAGHVSGDLLGKVLGDILGDLQGHVGGNVLGSVGSVVSAVTASQVLGDIVGNLSGHVTGDLLGNVVNPVEAGSGTVDFVTTDVPLAFRNIAFWPCVSGEDFPPIFSGAGYSTISNGLPGLPCVVISGNQNITWPFVPRISFSGKTTLTASGKFCCTIAPAGANKHFLGINPQSTHSTAAGPAAQLEFSAGAISGYSVRLAYLAAGSWTTTAPFIVNEPVATTIHTWEMVFTDTTLVVSIDGTTVASINAAVWPSTYASFSAPTPPYLAAVADASGRTMHATIQIAWT